MKHFLAIAVSTAAVFSTGSFGLYSQDYPSEIHYRFEDATTTDVIDSVSGLKHGVYASYSTQVAGLSSGIENRFSLRGTALIQAVPFVFNGNGAAGDASLEWLMYMLQENFARIFQLTTEGTSFGRFSFVATSGFPGADFPG